MLHVHVGHAVLEKTVQICKEKFVRNLQNKPTSTLIQSEIEIRLLEISDTRPEAHSTTYRTFAWEFQLMKLSTTSAV